VVVSHYSIGSCPGLVCPVHCIDAERDNGFESIDPEVFSEVSGLFSLAAVWIVLDHFEDLHTHIRTLVASL